MTVSGMGNVHNGNQKLSAVAIACDATTSPWIGDELIAYAANRQQMFWFRGNCFDVTSQPHDEIVDGARVGVFAQ